MYRSSQESQEKSGKNEVDEQDDWRPKAYRRSNSVEIEQNVEKRLK